MPIVDATPAVWISKPSRIIAAFALVLIAGCQTPEAHVPHERRFAIREAACTDEAMPAGFASDTAQVNGTMLHYVSGGQGPALIPIHGFPENWSAYARIMPRLASRFRVVAVALRGIGGSTPVQSLPRHLSERQGRRAGPRVNPIVVGRAAQGRPRDPPGLEHPPP
jgi:alpha-beta hydrolase superfamily lysophospholipase